MENNSKIYLCVCVSRNCTRKGSGPIFIELQNALPNIEVYKWGCLGQCDDGPNIRPCVGTKKLDLITRVGRKPGIFSRTKNPTVNDVINIVNAMSPEKV